MIYLKDVLWERIHLNLSLKIERAERIDSLRFYLVSLSGRVETEFTVTEIDGGNVRLSLNVTNNGLNRCVENDTYRILAHDGENEPIAVLYEGSFETLSQYGRSFVYDASNGVYSVSFMTDEYADLPELRLIFLNARSADTAKEDLYRKKSLSARLKGFLTRTADAVNVRFQRMIYSVVRAFSFRRRPRILFLDEKRDVLAPSMLALYNRLIERGFDKSYVIRCSLRNTESKSYSKLSTVAVIAKIAKADIIIVDDYVPAFNSVALKKDVKVIQLWHAGAGFKGVGYARWGHFGCPAPFSAHRRTDFAITDSMAIRDFFSEPFGILEEQVIPTGMPRMDEYLSEDNRRKVTARLYESYPMLKGKKIILFAPTYRGRNRKNSYYPCELIDFEGLYRYCEDADAVVLFKMHPWVADEVEIDEKYRDRFYPMNSYPNINELFYITDLLITDYSSCMYEFMLMKKPMLFFAFDHDRYAVSRGFHRDYASNVPGKICVNFEEVLTALREEDYEFEKVERMLSTYFDHVDTGSCDRVIDWLVLGDLPDEYASALQERRDRIARARAMKFESC